METCNNKEDEHKRKFTFIISKFEYKFTLIISITTGSAILVLSLLHLFQFICEFVIK